MSIEQNQDNVPEEFENLSSNPANDDALQKLHDLLQHARTLALVLSITMVIALIGNLFLAFLIIKMSRRRMGPVQILILHTCIADICFALCTALPQMASTLTFPYFYGGDFLCRLVKYLQLVPMFASPYLLVAISIDRYVAICRPLLALKWKYRLVHTLAGLAWAASLLFATPNIFAFRYNWVENTRIMACMFQMDEEFEKGWISVFSLIVWLAPSIIVGVLYTFVCAAVWESMRRPGKHFGSSNNTNQDPLLADGVAFNRRGSSGDQEATSMRKNFTPSINSYKVKTVKLTMTIVVANFALWAPFCITNVITTYFRHIKIDEMVITCIMLVGNANSCVNPWIYVVFNYKRVWHAMCGSRDQRFGSSSRNPTQRSKTTTPTTQHKASAEANNGYAAIREFESSGPSPSPYHNPHHRGHENNSQGRNEQRKNNNNNDKTATGKISQTSMISSASAFQ